MTAGVLDVKLMQCITLWISLTKPVKYPGYITATKIKNYITYYQTENKDIAHCDFWQLSTFPQLSVIQQLEYNWNTE